jgi:TetR/AcrR family transcriptional repressor of nem operon
MKKRPDGIRKRNATGRGQDMRSAIKTVAILLFTRFGFRGVSFADIALELGITTTNIHYHFGNKADLVEELILDQANMVSKRYSAIWTDSALTLEQKVHAVGVFNQEVYALHNKPDDDGHPWGLLVRLAADGDALNERARQRLTVLRQEIDDVVQAGVKLAVTGNEISDTVPQREVARLFTSLLLYGPFITRDTGGLEGLKTAHHTLLGLVKRAYSVPDKKVTAKKPSKKTPAKTRASRDFASRLLR